MTGERIEVTVAGVFMHQEAERPAQYFVSLRDRRGRSGGIGIGQFEAWAISFALDGEPPERPMTHDLAMNLLQAAGAVLEEVTVSDVREEMFYALARLRGPDGQTHEIDLRPSDAVAFALRAPCPVWVADAVMDYIADHGLRAGGLP